MSKPAIAPHLVTDLTNLPTLTNRSVSGRRHLNIRGTGPHVLSAGDGLDKGMRGLVFEFGRLVGDVGGPILRVDGRVIGLGESFHVGPDDRVSIVADGPFQLFLVEGHH